MALDLRLYTSRPETSRDQRKDLTQLQSCFYEYKELSIVQGKHTTNLVVTSAKRNRCHGSYHKTLPHALGVFRLCMPHY